MVEFLSIDHIYSGGNKHIKQLGGNGTAIYSWLIKNNFPHGFRTLCYNCNCSIGAYSYCPHHNAKSKEENRHSRVRIECITYYGGKCDCCGENQAEFLTIDHINRNGAAHRKVVGFGNTFYYWLRRNNYPTGYRVLCYNCNIADGFYGKCPHVITG